MWSLTPLLCIGLAVIIGVSSEDSCPKTYKKIGCFYDNLQGGDMIINGRNDIKWGEFHVSTHSLACRCIALARSQGYEYIQIGFYGECKGGKNFAKDFPKMRRVNTCVNVKYERCYDDSKHDCVGVANSGYIYKLDGGKDRDQADVNGGYSEWSEWTDCSRTCGEGVKDRERQCDNPLPDGEGKDCSLLGPTTETQSCKVGNCPVDGGWSDFGEFGACTASCGGGKQSASRTCTNPAPSNSGKNCEGEAEKSQACGEKSCPVDGAFTEWSVFGKCSSSCGGGFKKSTRSCTNPKPQHDGKDCNGDVEKTEECGTNPCPIDGGLSGWSDYDKCSKTCGGGSQKKTRTCTAPAPQHKGKDCVGKLEEIRECASSPCPVNGGFTEWSVYGKCSDSCGGGVQEKTRSCTNPAPAHGGKDCDGATENTQVCNSEACPIDGGFTDWEPFSECSKTCGGGSQNSRRTCTKPRPEHGGEECFGPVERTRGCNSRACPIDGGISAWGDFGTCTATCGGGTKSRSRTCTNPIPQHGGSGCSESLVEEAACNEDECPVDGGLSAWSAYTTCSVSCGGGSQTSTRSCTNPAPAHGGEDCTGDLSKSRECGTDACPIDGGLSDWSEYDTCSSECGGGIQTSTRSCSNPSPAHGGENCEGETEQTRKCNEQPCPIDGRYSDWSDYDKCTVSCGGGSQSSTRTCTSPAPQYDGAACVGDAERSRKCNTNPCPINGGFSDWSAFDKCTVSCGGGSQSSTRTCTNPAPQHSGNGCTGPTTKSQECGTNPCPVDGQFTKWSEYSKCTASCGDSGTQYKSRSCTNPAPAHGGDKCDGLNVEMRPCERQPCPIDGGFTEWSDYGACSEKCGGGSQESRRTCSNPAPAHEGKDCEGPTERSQECNTEECPIDGGFTDWTAYNACSKSCGGGEQSSSRTCTRPKPEHGGEPCEGEASKKRTCNNQPCPVDGGWSEYGDFETCSRSCGGGTQKKYRTCSKPAPAHGGNKCDGLSFSVRECNTNNCPIDGGFTAWSKPGECTKECGGGIQTASRSCTAPTPQYGGAECKGDKTLSSACNTQACPIDGGFSKWSDYTDCSSKCAGGSKSRTRSCNNPTPEHGGAQCVGDTFESLSCNTHPCPVDGGFTDWSAYDKCSKSCGGGTMEKKRSCSNPAPAHGGSECVGLTSLTAACNTRPCPIDGGYTAWSVYGKCSEECGGGVQTSSRSCTKPSPAHGGDACDGAARRSRTCNNQPCPVDGGFTDWSEYNVCTKTCGGGTQSSARSCSNPTPAHGGNACVGMSTKIRACNTHACPVDGQFGSWASFEECSKECGGGIQKRYRQCNKPAPAHGGSACIGDSMQMKTCNTHHCPVDGAYGKWSDYNACPKACGGAVQRRERKCDNPAPAYGGNPCVGAALELKACNTHACPINGGFGVWSKYDACTETCGGGVQESKRVCNKPVPQHGGADCAGPRERTQSCNTQACPVDGGFTAWGAFNACSKKCGSGFQTSKRSCTRPVPAHGGAACTGAAARTRGCNTHACPIDGKFGAWGAYSKCSRNCGGGTQDRSRDCNNPAPQHGGNACIGSGSEVRACNTHACPVNGNWAAFGSYGVCSKKCGGGIQKRTRACNNPAPAHGGANCAGSAFGLKACNTHHCPVNGNWGKWAGYGSCSKNCGGGIQYRSRACNNPAAAHGGAACAGSGREMRACNTHHCPVNGGWGGLGAYGACSAACGGGIQRAYRKCNNPPAAHGGALCSGSASAVKACNTHHCPVNGKWGGWGSYSACSKTCGGGVQKRLRSCNSPAPAHGGAACAGSTFEIKACNTHHCPVNGGWGNWGAYGKCTATCGGGIQRSYKQCNNPTPAHGGAKCVGMSMRIQGCNTHHCKVDGEWGGWGKMSACSKTCGGGIQRKYRQCNNPAPSDNGAKCAGSPMMLAACNTHDCKVNGNWGAWGAYSACTRNCNGGIKRRMRACNNPTPKGGGAGCAGNNAYISACNTHRCAGK